jgi:hypothetical protein
MTDTNAVAPLARASGKRSNFSISGKLMSICDRPVSFRPRIISGKRCRVCGPNTKSTKGAREVMPSPSWLATHPPTPMTICGRSSFSKRHCPSSENTFSCAFSRTEHVFTSNTSADAGSSVRAMPCAASRTSRILSESYSFIWQPNVFMYKRPGIGSHGKGR